MFKIIFVIALALGSDSKVQIEPDADGSMVITWWYQGTTSSGAAGSLKTDLPDDKFILTDDGYYIVLD